MLEPFGHKNGFNNPILYLIFQWDIFRESHNVFKHPEWNKNRALLLYPGNVIKIFNTDVANYTFQNDERTKYTQFNEAFFHRLQLKDRFVHNAQKILRFIIKKHEKLHAEPKKTKKLKNVNLEYVFVGIHSRRTDHLEYQKKHNMNALDARYYLEAMNLYREKFKKENKKKRLIFIFVSDDIQWGKDKLSYRVKERDLYFGGSVLPDVKDAIGLDFALLASCNHTIESHGSFSFFASAFAGGFKIKPNHFTKYREKKHMENPFWARNPLDILPPRISSF